MTPAALDALLRLLNPSPSTPQARAASAGTPDQSGIGRGSESATSLATPLDELDLDGLWTDDALPDFLGAAPAPSRPTQALAPLARAPVDDPRRIAAAAAVAQAASVPLLALIDTLERADGLAADVDLDGEAVWAALSCLVTAMAQGREADRVDDKAEDRTQGRAVGHGRVSVMLRRGLQAADLTIVELALLAAAGLGLRELQEVVAEQLRDRPAALGVRGVNVALDCLADLGDGRCVRIMEDALLRQAAVLTEHQAWRARHIVQAIRRDHRR